MQSIPATTPELRKLPEVVRQTGLSRSTIYRLAKTEPAFQLIKISARASAFDGHAVDAWIHARIAEARRAAA